MSDQQRIPVCSDCGVEMTPGMVEEPTTVDRSGGKVQAETGFAYLCENEDCVRNRSADDTCPLCGSEMLHVEGELRVKSAGLAFPMTQSACSNEACRRGAR